MLYPYRVLMTGIHLLDTGEVEANLRRLNRHFGLVFLGDLIALKTVERATVDLDWKFQVAQLAEFLHVRAILVRQGFSLSDRWSVLFGHEGRGRHREMEGRDRVCDGDRSALLGEGPGADGGAGGRGRAGVLNCESESGKPVGFWGGNRAAPFLAIRDGLGSRRRPFEAFCGPGDQETRRPIGRVYGIAGASVGSCGARLAIGGMIDGWSQVDWRR